MGAIGREPIFIARGSGSRMWDVDGNDYVDWVSSWGPLIAGHAHPAVVDAVASASTDGTSFGAPTEGEVKLAAEVAARVPSVEPCAANMGVVPPVPGFLEALRSCADQIGALLVFDEVITGFRVARGGAQDAFGVLPDLTIMGKVLGGGLPAAAFGGPEVLMERVAPAGDVYQAGTLSGNPLAVAAGLATLRLLDDRAYRRLESITDELACGLRDAAREAGCEVQVQAMRGLLTVFFAPGPVTDYGSACASDLEAFATFARALLERGVYPPPSQFEAWFPSLAHSKSDVEHTLAAAREAFAEAAGR
jgi:glutamate-1-semialdehyde 2,1-aminomutase